MKKFFLLGGVLTLTLYTQSVFAQSVPPVNLELKTDLSTQSPKLEAKPVAVVYDRSPSMWLIQNRNILVFDSGIGDRIEKISVRTGGPGLQSKKGEYNIPWFTKDPVYFPGWGSTTLFGDHVWPFVPKGQTIASMVARGELVGAGHTQPRHCDSLQNYLGKQKKWGMLTNQFLKANDMLQKSDPVAFNKAYSEFTNKNPKPINPCSKPPDRAWGSSHGCVRVDGLTAPFIITWMEFHHANRKPLTLFIDQRPPSLPVSYQP
jgi:hypothetical protein